MKRIIVMVLKNIIFVPYYWIMLNWYAAHVDKYTEEQRYAMLKKIDHAWVYVLSESPGII